MGADGHIVYFDRAKVDKRAKQLKCEIPRWWYRPTYKVDGRSVYLAYWDTERIDFVEPDEYWDDDKQIVLKMWAIDNAKMYDQEVWT